MLNTKKYEMLKGPQGGMGPKARKGLVDDKEVG